MSSDDDVAATAAPMSRRRVLGSMGLIAASTLAGCATPQDSTAAEPSQGSTNRPGNSKTSTSPTTASPSTRPSATNPPHVSGATAKEIVHGSRDMPTVALTFHGAGNVALAEQLLAAFATARVKVTVFAVGNWLEQQPALGQKILTAGHDLGNHTYQHLPMRTMSAQDAYDEISRGNEAITRAVGQPPSWFRPSGTPHATQAILQAAGKAGYAHSLSFDVDPRDYADPGANAVASRTLSAVTNGSIISLHFGHVGTLAALPAILLGLHRRGLTPVTLTQLLPGISR